MGMCRVPRGARRLYFGFLWDLEEGSVVAL